MDSASKGSPRWIFDQLPPSGARRGGDPSEHAFRHDLETFVREVVQNANDQSLGRPEVHFALMELSGAELEGGHGDVDHEAAAVGGEQPEQFVDASARAGFNSHFAPWNPIRTTSSAVNQTAVSR